MNRLLNDIIVSQIIGNVETINGEIVKHGSFFSPKIEYSSDIDLNEHLDLKDFSKKRQEELVKKFQAMGQRIKKNPNIIYVNFKAGVSQDVYLDVGKISETGKIIEFSPDKVKKYLQKQIAEKKLPKKEGEELIQKTKKTISYQDFFLIKNKIKDLYRINWTLDELIKGKKGNIKLIDVLFYHKCRIDVILKMSDMDYIEASNAYYFYQCKDGEKVFMNQEKDEDTACLSDLIELLYENRYLKALKRLRSILGEYCFRRRCPKKEYYIVRDNIKDIINHQLGYQQYVLTKLKLIDYLYNNKYIDENQAKWIANIYTRADSIETIRLLIPQMENRINEDAKKYFKINIELIKNIVPFSLPKNFA